ncbi:MAG: fibro-slime domain-containing protein [Phycisphaerales bacterium]|jgi:fibro-slime domain-containing protein|nr:fibro-slime domain-containing protein [Phycisphaerales bacterium]
MGTTSTRNDRVGHLLAGFAGLVIASCATGASAQSSGSLDSGQGGGDDPYAYLPSSISVQAVIRDFREAQAPNGHPDFEVFSGTLRVGHVANQLDEDGKPVLASAAGWEVSADYRDAAGHPINPALYDPDRGDQAGILVERDDARITSEESFASWYRDTPGVNTSIRVPIVMQRQHNSNIYVFDSAVAEPYKTRGGFFPIDGQGYGNYSSTGHNFHFTTELATQFVYDADAGSVFKFAGDDDVWVYIDDKLVIDLGSVHGKREQYLDLSRLDWLEDGRAYTLRVFHAERKTNQSNFRIETSLMLRSLPTPATAALFD